MTLNRPERHNSLVPPLLEEMLEALGAIGGDGRLRSVILQANGRSFSTGGDMRGFYEQLDDLEGYASRIVGLLNQVIQAMVELPTPIVAAVHGTVTGGSLGLVLGVLIIPLLFPLHGLMQGRPYTYAWSSFLALFYFIHAVLEIYSTPQDRYLAVLELILSLAFYIGAVSYAKLGGRELKKRSGEESTE